MVVFGPPLPTVGGVDAQGGFAVLHGALGIRGFLKDAGVSTHPPASPTSPYRRGEGGPFGQEYSLPGASHST